MQKIVLFMALVSILAVTTAFPAMAIAQSPDQILVVDGANLFRDKIGQVEAAAGTVVSRGADVRIRTILTYGTAGNLDQYEIQLEQQSPSWMDQNGGRKNNLIVLIVSLQERQTGLYFGSFWDNAIGDNWLRIQTDVMNPLFRDGDYAGGVVKGLAEIERLIAAQTKTQTQTQPGTSTGQSKTWILLLVVLAIVGLAIGLFLFRGFRQGRAKISAARQKAMLAKQGAASGINELIEATQMLEIKVNVTAETLAPDDVELLRSGLAKAKGLVDQSSQTYSELAHSAGDPESRRLGESELGTIEAEYQKILASLRQAREDIKGVEERIALARQAAERFPVTVAEAKKAMEEALDKQEELKRSGFKTARVEEFVAMGRGSLERAQDMASKNRFDEGLKYAIQAVEQMKQASAAAEELPRNKKEAESAIPALAARIQQVKGKISDGRVVFDRLSREYADTTWESVRGNGTEAENRVDWATDAEDAARSAADTKQQDWQRAREMVDKGNDWLAEAESLMKSLADLEANVIASKRDAPNEIDAAQADVTQAWSYIKRYDDDIRESLEDDLRAAEQKNDTAREELKKEKPDYFLVCKLAREANEAADKILVQARDEHEAAERLRAKAVSARRDASAKVSIANKYIEDHQSVVKNEARGSLKDAVESLRQADATADAGSQVSLALKAESSADQAYALARRDVNLLEESRPPWSAPDQKAPGGGTTVFFPPVGRASGGNPPWGTPRRSSPIAGKTIWRGGGGGGGGSSSWGSRGGGSGGAGGHRGGGSTGW